MMSQCHNTTFRKAIKHGRVNIWVTVFLVRDALHPADGDLYSGRGSPEPSFARLEQPNAATCKLTLSLQIQEPALSIHDLLPSPLSLLAG